jgi:hypothetical protein
MWIYENKPFVEVPDGIIGFVYEITCKSNGKRYLGKKNFFFSKTKQVKGKKKKFKIDSDWQTYFGSNKEIQEHVALYGEDKFERKILRLCSSKGEMTYYETKLIFETDAIISEQYYNDWCMCRVRRSHVVKKGKS